MGKCKKSLKTTVIKDGVDDAEQLPIIANVSKANRVVGCLVQWLTVQLQCNDILSNVEPELARLDELQLI